MKSENNKTKEEIKMKKFVCGFLIGAMMFSVAGAFAVSYIANPVDFKVMVNGKEFISNPPALEVDGRTYLPLRAMGDALGVAVNWNEELRQAEVGNMSTSSTTSYSRNNPAPLNTIQNYNKVYKSYLSDINNDYTVDIRVVETIRGDKAMEKLLDANMFNSSADDGFEYVLVKVAFSVKYVENDAALNISSYDFTAYSSTNEEMPSVFLVTPEPSLSGTNYANSNTEGWICVQVRKEDGAPKLAYGLEYDGTGGVWFSLQ